jgi:VWFA-related protein
MTLRRTTAAFALLAATLAPAQTPTDTLRVTSRIVVLDVTVTDKAGNLVPNLTQADFTVLEDKVPQPIRSFEAPSAHRLPGSAPGVTPDLVHSAADLPKIGSAPVTLLVLDELNTRFEDMSFGRQQLVKYLQAQPAVLAQPTTLLYAANSKFTQLRDYTQERDALLDDLKRHMPEYPSKMMTGKQGPAAVERMAQTLASLQQLAQASAGTPGRKNVVWVGVGFSPSNLIGLDPATAATIQSAIRRVTDALLASRITLYTINPTANTTTTLDISTVDDLDNAEDENGGTLDSGPFSGLVQFSNFAPATGGRAFLSRNDIHNEIADAIAAGATYYTLSYAPTSTSADPAKYRNIRVVMRDPSLHATTRNGYYAAAAASTSPSVADPAKQTRAQIQLDLSNAVTSAISYNGLKLSARRADGANYAITVSESNPASSIAWRPTPDGKAEQAEATVLAAWYDGKGKLLGHTAQELTATRPLSGPAQAGPAEATFTLAVPLGGAHPERLRLVVRDAVSGRMGTIDLKP